MSILSSLEDAKKAELTRLRAENEHLKADFETACKLSGEAINDLKAENEDLRNQLDIANQVPCSLGPYKLLEAENETLKDSCRYHAKMGRQRLDRIKKLWTENEKLREENNFAADQLAPTVASNAYLVEENERLKEELDTYTAKKKWINPEEAQNEKA